MAGIADISLEATITSRLRHNATPSSQCRSVTTVLRNRQHPIPCPSEIQDAFAETANTSSFWYNEKSNLSSADRENAASSTNSEKPERETIDERTARLPWQMLIDEQRVISTNGQPYFVPIDVFRRILLSIPNRTYLNAIVGVEENEPGPTSEFKKSIEVTLTLNRVVGQDPGVKTAVR
jgi:hypothetical protein